MSWGKEKIIVLKAGQQNFLNIKQKRFFFKLKLKTEKSIQDDVDVPKSHERIQLKYWKRQG